MTSMPTAFAIQDLVGGLICLTVFTGGSLWIIDSSAAQETVEAGQRALEQRGFPWLDPERQTVTELDRPEPGRAASLNRNELPVRAPDNGTRTTVPANGSSFGPVLNAVVWVTITVLFALIVAILVRQFLKMESQRDDQAFQDELDRTAMLERITQLPFDVRHATDTDFREQAARAANRNDFGPATMLLFSHMLLQLDQRELIQLKKGKTNRQYLMELRTHESLAAYYQQVMIAFEDFFFGNEIIDRHRFDTYWKRLDTFQQQLEHQGTMVG